MNEDKKKYGDKNETEISSYMTSIEEKKKIKFKIYPFWRRWKKNSTNPIVFDFRSIHPLHVQMSKMIFRSVDDEGLLALL